MELLDLLERARVSELMRGCGKFDVDFSRYQDKINDLSWNDAYQNMLRWVFEEPFSFDLQHIIALHDCLNHVDHGLRNADITMTDGEYKFDMMPVNEIHKALEDYCSKINCAMQKENYDVVSVCAEAHIDFAMIHPFFGYNGRVARLLVNAILLRSGYHALFLTGGWRTEYNNALREVRLSGDRSLFTNLLREKILENEQSLGGELNEIS